MVTTEIRNIHEIEEVYLPEIRQLIKQRKEYFDNFFKKYSKDIIIDIEFNKEKLYRVNIETKLISKLISVTELDRNPVEALRKAFAEFKKAVKKQIALERKDYLYKRKRYRQQKWKMFFTELTGDIEESKKEDKPKCGKKVKNALKSVQKYLKKRLKELGFTKKQIKAQLPGIMEAIERRFYGVFDPKQHGPEDLDALLFGITEDILRTYQNTRKEEEGELEIREFENDSNAPQEENYAPELYFAEDFSENEQLIEKINNQFTPEEIDRKVEEMISRLPQEQQAAVHLHFLEQFTPAEIAGITGMSSSEVENTIAHFKEDFEINFKKELK